MECVVAGREEDIVEIQQEISALRTCRSPHIVQYFSSYLASGTSQLHIVMELMAASAADLATDDSGEAVLPERCIAFILRQVLKALVYLHSQGRLHRDIKAANILLSSRGDVKVSDFGVSAQLSGTVGYKRRTFVGSPLWMAPEVIEQSPDAGPPRGGAPSDDGGYDTSADIWSLGVTAIEVRACGVAFYGAVWLAGWGRFGVFLRVVVGMGSGGEREEAGGMSGG